ncbi:MAG TPA: DMT family transporter [Bacteroidales bacterium]|nr:DMT family transporter [Bacteroidales bacterium]
MSTRIRSDLTLLLASLVWGFAFVAQRVGMEYVGPFTFTAVRFTLGCCILAPLLLFRKKYRFGQQTSLTAAEKRKVVIMQLLLGLVLFGGMSFQQWGIQFTTAGHTGFITGFYVVLVPIASLFFGQKNHWSIWGGALLALTGLFFLSIRKDFTVNPGDYFVMICALFWTVHVMMVGYIAPRSDPVRTSVIQFLICAVLSWIVVLGSETILLTALRQALWPILYGGIMSVGIGYTLQIFGQQKAHPAYASIILSLEAVFAVIGGWLILHEPLSARTLLGCGLMLSGMVLVQLRR